MSVQVFNPHFGTCYSHKFPLLFTSQKTDVVTKDIYIPYCKFQVFILEINGKNVISPIMLFMIVFKHVRPEQISNISFCSII